MAFLHGRGLAQEHIADYVRRNQEGVWTATFPTTLPDDAYFDTWITTNALTLLDRAPNDKPWYLEVNLQNPHHPWDVTESMHRWYREPPVDFPLPLFNTENISPETHQEVRRNWAATVEHLDQCLGRLLERVCARGDLENTVVVFTSDHGEMLGDYNQWQKLSPLQACGRGSLGNSRPGGGCRRSRRRSDDDPRPDRQLPRVGRADAWCRSRQSLPCRLSRRRWGQTPRFGVFWPECLAHGLRRPFQVGSRLRPGEAHRGGCLRADAHSARGDGAPSARSAPNTVRSRAQRKGRRVLCVSRGSSPAQRRCSMSHLAL